MDDLTFQERKLAHYGFSVQNVKRSWGEDWVFSPCAIYRSFKTKADALYAAEHELQVRLRRHHEMTELIRTAPIHSAVKLVSG